MKKLIIAACATVMILVAPIAANAGTVYLGNNSATTLNGKYVFPGSKSGYFSCDNNVQQSAGCQTTHIVVSTASGSGDAGGTQSSPTYLGTCTFSSCVCNFDEYLSGNTCVKCSSNSRWTNVVATSDKTYHTKTTCDQCLPEMLRMAPAAGVIVCYCPDNGTCANHQVTCNKGYYRVDGSSTSAYKCEACEAYATTDGAGATSHTECCYPTTQNFTDSIGTYHYSSKCCYTN